MPLRVWSEFLSLPELAQPDVARLLARFDCGVLLRLHESQLNEDLPRSLAACAQAGVPYVGLWLLLDEAAGYWPSERNAALVRRCVERATGSGTSWLAIDLEPPLSQMRELGALRGGRKLLAQARAAHHNLDPQRFHHAWMAYRDILATAHAAGVRVLCAAHDYLAEDVWLGRPIQQDLHEAPVLGLPWDALSVMLYGSTMFAPAVDTRRWLFDTALQLRRARIGASIGLTAAGVLGREPHYLSPHDLAADASALKAAGVHDFAVYSLEGILASPHPEEWFQAVVSAEAAVPAASRWALHERCRRRLRTLFWACFRAARSRGPRR